MTEGVDYLDEARRVHGQLAPADARQLLDDLAAFVRRFVRMSEEQAVVWALWVVHTYAVDVAEATPYLHVSSPERRSGKTRVLEVSAEIVKTPLSTANISDAAFFRAIAMSTPTLLFDEVDAIFGPKARDREDMRGMLNAGYRRSAEVWRCVGDGSKQKVEAFPVFCAKVLAGLGELPDTVADRCLPIRLERQAPGERVERFRRRDVEGEVERLRERVETFLGHAHDDLDGARPDLPEELDDRGQDVVEPILAIADAVGGPWPERSRRAVVALRAERQIDDESSGVRLLADVRTILEERNVDRLSTEGLLDALHGLDEAPWSEWYGKSLTSRGLSKLLKPYSIRSRSIRFDDGTTPKGYKADQFESAFSRYLPSSRHNATTGSAEPKVPDPQAPQDGHVADREEAAIRHHERDVADVAARGRGERPEWTPDTVEAFIAQAKAIFPGSREIAA